MTKQSKGFSAVAGVIIILIIGIGVAVGYYFYDQNTEVKMENSNMTGNQNQNTNTSMPANSKICEQDTDCELRFGCTDYGCYHKDSPEPVENCEKTINPEVAEGKTCVCAEKECTLVENNQ